MDETRNDADAPQPETPGATPPPVQSPPVQAPPVQAPPVQAPPVQAPPEPQPGRRRYGRSGWDDDQHHPFDPRRKSPLLASFLSLMPGLGQVYVGYYQAGFIHPLVVSGIIVMLARGDISGFEPFLGFFLAFFWMYNIIDAGRRAAHYNQVLEGDGKVELPSGFLAPGKGSVAGGVCFILIGGILLANTVLDISLGWLSDWWPLAPILFGVYLVVKATKEKESGGNGRSG